MFLILFFLPLLQLLLTEVQCYVLFAANIDDFHTIAKQFVPDKLADQLTKIAAKSVKKDKYGEQINSNENDDISSTENEELKVNFEELVKKVKEKIETDLTRVASTRGMNKKMYLNENSNNRERVSIASYKNNNMNNPKMKPQVINTSKQVHKESNDDELSEGEEYYKPYIQDKTELFKNERIPEKTPDKKYFNPKVHKIQARPKHVTDLKKSIKPKEIKEWEQPDYAYFDSRIKTPSDKQKKPDKIRTNEKVSQNYEIDEDLKVYEEKDRINLNKKISPQQSNNDEQSQYYPIVQNRDRITAHKNDPKIMSEYQNSEINDDLNIQRPEKLNKIKTRLTPNKHKYDYLPRDTVFVEPKRPGNKPNINRPKHQERNEETMQSDKNNPKGIPEYQDSEVYDDLNSQQPKNHNFKDKMTPYEPNQDEYLDPKDTEFNKPRKPEKATINLPKHQEKNKANMQKNKKKDVTSNKKTDSEQYQDYDSFAPQEYKTNTKSKNENIKWQSQEGRDKEKVSYSKDKGQKDYKDTENNEPHDESQELFNAVNLQNKKDSYEDYVTPKKDYDYYSNEELSNKPSQNNNRASKPSVTRFVAKTNPRVSFETTRASGTPPRDGVVHKGRGTMIPTREFYKMSTPNYLAKIPVVAEKYDFNEPLPENDRLPEDLKPIGNPPALINKKVRLE